MNLDRRLLLEAWAVRIPLGLAVAAGLLGGIATVFQARYLSGGIAAVFLGGRGLDGVLGLLGGFLLASAARAALVGARELASARASRVVRERLRDRALAGVIARGPASLSAERTGDLASNLVEGVEALDAYYAQYLPSLALALLVPLVVLAFVLPLDVLTGIVFAVTGPLIPIFMVLIGKLAEQETRRQWDQQNRLSAHFLDVLQGLPTLRLFGRSKRQAEVVSQISGRFGDLTLRVLRIAFLSALVLELLSTISTAVIAVEVGLRLLYGQMAFEEAFFLLILAPEFYQPLRALGASFHAGLSGVAAANRVFGLLEGAEEPGAAASEPGAGIVSAPERVEFRDVGYVYADGDEPALDGVSFAVERGARIALVGPSGAGKSTIAAFLLRFRSPTSGEIRVDGEPLADVPVPAWRRLIAWVPERPHLFHGTVADNIRLAKPEATAAEVVAAAAAANADEFIRGLPLGYETQVGDNGARLSGGQAQRIALARAFLMDAPILLLDEATASLDVESESRIQEAIERVARGRTTVVIAHRLSTVRAADLILVFDGGRLVDQGSHAGLLARGGLYRDFLAGADDQDGQTDSSLRPRAGRSGSFMVTETAVGGTTSPPLGPDSQATDSSLRPPEAGSSGMTEGPLPPRPVLLRLLGLMLPFWKPIVLAVLLGALTVGSGIGLLGISAFIIAKAALHPSIAELQVAIVGVRFLGISRGVFRYLERYVSHRVTFRLLQRLHVWLYRSIEPLAPAGLAGYRGGDLLSRLVADVQTLEHFYVRVVAPPAVAVVVGLGLWLGLRLYSPVLAWALVAFLLLAGVGQPLLAGRLGRDPGRRLVASRSELTASVVDAVQGLADLLAFGQAGRQHERVREVSHSLGRAREELARIAALNVSVQSLLTSLAVLSTLVLAVPMVGEGRLSGVDLAVLAIVASAAFEAVLPLPVAFQYLESCLAAGRRLFEVVDARPTVVDPVEPSPAPADGSLVARSLGFAYGPNEPRVLDGVSFEVGAGETLAIVGPSGAGKSTIVSLLARFWEYEGEIRLGSHDLRAYHQEDARRLIAVSAQRPHLFSATVRDNLKLARPEADDAALWDALRVAQLEDLVRSLPAGLDTWVGENGLRLSGGERQRLAIARALLRDAPILVLDEPTANLDVLTARALLEAVRRSCRARALLIVTHQLTGLSDDDQVLVLDGGRVVERGRLAELLERDEAYRRMSDLQRRGSDRGFRAPGIRESMGGTAPPARISGQ